MEKIEKIVRELKELCRNTNCNDCPLGDKSMYNMCKIGIEVDEYDYTPATWNIQ